jgi:hypothetical protein
VRRRRKWWRRLVGFERQVKVRHVGEVNHVV